MSASVVADGKTLSAVGTVIPDDMGEAEETIHIAPHEERAALRKFDLFLLPVAFLFMLLSSLDRSNVRCCLVSP